jgi:hypothetical protein
LHGVKQAKSEVCRSSVCQPEFVGVSIVPRAVPRGHDFQKVIELREGGESVGGIANPARGVVSLQENRTIVWRASEARDLHHGDTRVRNVVQQSSLYFIVANGTNLIEGIAFGKHDIACNARNFRLTQIQTIARDGIRPVVFESEKYFIEIRIDVLSAPRSDEQTIAGRFDEKSDCRFGDLSV